MSDKVIDGLLVVLAIVIGVTYALWVGGGGPPYVMGG